jgi:histidinol-phosphate aminotransferase
LQFDVAALRSAIEREQPDVTVICSPNNPTGCVLGEGDVDGLLSAARGLVVVDEAYHEFSGQTVAGLLDDHPNLLVFRTFSKALGLAGLRVGYLLAAPGVAREVSKAVLPYNLNVFSQTAAEVAVELYEGELRPRIAEIVAERERLFAGLKNVGGLSPVASRANFMVVRTTRPPRRVYEELLGRGVLVRDVSGYPMLDDYFRVSVGTREENDLLLAGLRDIFAAAPAGIGG